MDQNRYSFQKSDIGAQSAWKGFSAQTLYIASRILNDQNNSLFYPEDIEDLVVKKDNSVIEAVQVKYISANLSLSSLASTKSSQSGEGFFRRACSLHKDYPDFCNVRVVYFKSLGAELFEFSKNMASANASLKQKLVENHGLSVDDAEWLLSSLKFEKQSLEDLDSCINKQIRGYLPTMAAPDMAKSLLIQYVSNLSKSKGYTSLSLWQEEIHRIGTNIAAIDGYFKEYGKSLIRLSELSTSKTSDQLYSEFTQGVSTHPAHIRENLDYHRTEWIGHIQSALSKSGIAVIKGVSGQGKSALCYRYLIDHYPEELVFCVRSVATEAQAYNLVSALESLAKYAPDIAVYIDVQPGENHWVFLLQELQMRELTVPVLISIRDEDFNITPKNGTTAQFDIIELSLSEQEAHSLFDLYTKDQLHPDYRSFEEAWIKFGTHGPLIEFMYLLTNSQTLTQRLNEQVDALLLEQVPDTWLEILHLVCLTGRLGCSINVNSLRKVVACDNINAAIRRFSDEYLIRISDNGNIVNALHPVRAQILFDALNSRICCNHEDVVIKAISCTEPSNIRNLLMDYFSSNQYTPDFISRLATTKCPDWTAYAGILNTMLWLDVKRYIDANTQFFNDLIKRQGWQTLLPIDFTGLLCPNVVMAENILNMPGIKTTALQTSIQEVKSSLTSLCIDYQATDIFIGNCTLPNNHPKYDSEWANLGYSLFWLSNRKFPVENFFTISALKESMKSGDIQSMADCLRGMIEHESFSECCSNGRKTLISRIIKAYQVLFFEETPDTVCCKFVPPMFGKIDDDRENTDNYNQYWRLRMLSLLQQIFPEKEYIDIELLGVDLFRDLGIEPLDYKLHINKKNRPNRWIAEVNAWVLTRIYYQIRPRSWAEYVGKIDCVRISASELVNEIIGFIDFLYKKRRFSKERWGRIEEKHKKFNMVFSDNHLLPISVVDSYCLFREDMQEKPGTDILPDTVCADKYKNFRNSFSKTFQTLDNFFRQYEEVLAVRIFNKSIDAIGNPRLAIYNLFDSAKNIVKLQAEYRDLFFAYSTLDSTFAEQELANLLILINMWSEVLTNTPRGFSLSYEAKEKYKKSFAYFKHVISNLSEEAGVEVYSTEKYTYLTFPFDPTGGTTLEQEFENAVLRLREEFKDSISYSSERWQLETQAPCLIYVPLYQGVPLAAGFSIPIYKLLDSAQDKISSSMFPLEDRDEIDELLGINTDGLIRWKKAISQVGSIQLLLQQYDSLVETFNTDKCKEGLATYLSTLDSSLKIVYDSFSDVLSIIEMLQESADELVVELLGMIGPFFKSIAQIQERISSLEIATDIEDMANNAVTGMVLLQPYVVSQFVQIPEK